MYQLNDLMRNVLITPAEVIFHAPTKHTLDPRTIQQSIIIAEERFIRPELDGLYDAMCDEKNKEITSLNIATYQPFFTSYTLKVGDVINAFEFLSTDNLKLWKQHLWKLIAECVMIIAYPEAYVQFGTQGVMHTVAPMSPMGGAGDVGPDLRTVKWMMDQKQYRIDPLLQSMHGYICKYNALYPAYTRYCPCEDKNNTKRSDIVLGIYDDKEEDCRCHYHERDTHY
jgi:hypothetical protein